MIYFVRHGQSQANLDGVFAGPRLPAPLTDQGIQQARDAAADIRSQQIRIDKIIASPIERALHTAQIIAEGIGYEISQIQIDPRLAEYDMGDLSGQPMAGVTPDQKVSAPGAEDPRDFQARVQAALNSAAEFEGNVLLVSHAGVGRMIASTNQGLDPARFYEIEGYANAKVVSL